MTNVNPGLDALREIVADVLEIETHELDDEADFVEEYEADSLRAIEMLARLEKHFDIEVPQSELADLRNLRAVHELVARYVGESS